jgi:L-lactate dehydrogenase (cytochrome)
MAQPRPKRIFKDLSEIFSHNTKESLWLLINNKVYDVTNFKHPGKMAVLLMNAGQDAT